MLSQLSPIARLLAAAERSENVETAAIDVDLPRPYPSRHPQSAIPVSGPDSAPQAVDGFIGNAYRLFLVPVGNDRQDGAEDLLAGNGHIRAYPAEDGGLDVEPSLQAFGS